MVAKKDEGHKRALNYLVDLADTTDFKFAVSDIRKNLGIVSHGYKPTPKDKKLFTNPYHIPFSHTDRDKCNKAQFAEELFTQMTPIVRSLPIQSLFYFLLLRNYIFYNEFFISETKKQFSFYKHESVCMFDFEEVDLEKIENPVLIQKLKNYPVVIRIGIDASGVDITNFLKANGEFLRELQLYYKDLYGYKFNLSSKKRKVKPKIKERNDFIYRNRNKAPKELHELLRKMGHNVDPAYITKIKKKEVRRRDKKLGKD